ncbi:hypothetical protein Hamer_G016832, partial [Homarus americanus]
EEISAVFVEPEARPASRENHPPRPRTPARPPLLDGQASPSKIRKVYSGVGETPTCSVRRQGSTPSSHPRRRVPFFRKTRRVSAPALTTAQVRNGGSTPPPWQPRTDPHLQQWSKGLLKDFHSLVEEEIRTLHGHPPPRHTNNGAPVDFNFQRFLSGDSGQGVDVARRSRRTGERDSVGQRGEDGGRERRPVRRVTLPGPVSNNMGATHSAGRDDTLTGERQGAFKTYTLPRSGGHRSVSLCGAGAITYRASAAHPDDTDVSCQLLRVNPRFSRSHSLDEGAGLSPWALHHLSVIDGAHAEPPTPADASNSTSQATLYPIAQSEPVDVPATPRSARDAAAHSLCEGHYGKIRKTGYAEKHNEQFRPSIVERRQVNGGGRGLANGWKDHTQPAHLAGAAHTDATNFTDTAKLHKASETFLNTNGSSAFTPSDLRKGVSESWEWADQEGACSLTDRPCDPEACPHCRARLLSSTTDEKSTINTTDNPEETTVVVPGEATREADASEYRERVSVCVTAPEVTDDNNFEEVNMLDLELPGERLACGRECGGSGRKSEPSLLSVITPGQLDARRHTLPTPRVYGSLSLLSAPAPTFNTSSWETLPPADELEVELEEKPITGSVVRPLSRTSISPTSSRSLNSSLSSLSLLSVHRSHSECDSWPSSPVTQQYLTPEIFFDPTTIACHTPDDLVFKDWDDGDVIMTETEGRMEGPRESGGEGQASYSKASGHAPWPEPITGLLHLTPVGAQGRRDIIFSVSIPENRKKDKHKTNPSFSSPYESSDISTVCDASEAEETTREEAKKERTDAPSDTLCPRLATITLQDEAKGDLRPKRETSNRSDTKDCSVTDLSSSSVVEGSAVPPLSWQLREEARDRCDVDLRKPPPRYRSFSLDETRTTLHNQNTRLHRPEALDDFLRAVESRIRRGSMDQPPQDLPPPPCFPPSPLSTPASTPVSTAAHDLSFSSTVVFDAFTQTTPAPTPPPASRASSDTWLSEYGCDDLASMEPCASSLALSATEDDYGEDYVDDDDDWSRDGSLSSSSPPPTPASMPRDDSSLSLSESLDTLDLNGESGIGTVSTRPSVSPHPHVTLDLSGSNLSSEDTGLENSFERRIRRYIPHNRSGRESEHSSHYRPRRPRPRHHEQWVRREDQTTQTDPEPPTLAHSIDEDSHDSYRESNETLEGSRGGSVERMVRHTHSEPRLDSAIIPVAGVLRGVYSEAALPPLPLHHSSRTPFTPSAPTLPTLTEDKPPKAPSKPTRPRHLSLVSPNHQSSPGKACSAPTLETRPAQPHAAHTPATTPSEDSSGETPMLTTRAQSSKEIADKGSVKILKLLERDSELLERDSELLERDSELLERDSELLERDSELLERN